MPMKTFRPSWSISRTLKNTEHQWLKKWSKVTKVLSLQLPIAVKVWNGKLYLIQFPDMTQNIYMKRKGRRK